MAQPLRAVIACSAAKLRHACPSGSLACCARASFDSFCGLLRMHARMHSKLCLLQQLLLPAAQEGGTHALLD